MVRAWHTGATAPRCVLYRRDALCTTLFFTLCGALRSSELPVRATAARSLRLLAVSARLLFAPGYLDYFLFFFNILGEMKVRAGKCDAPAPAPLRGLRCQLSVPRDARRTRFTWLQKLTPDSIRTYACRYF